MKKTKLLAHFTDFNHTKERREKNTFGALGYYRIFKPAKQLSKFDVDIVGTDIITYGKDFESNWQNIYKKYDITWIMHFLGEQNQAAQAYFAREYNKKLVYDIDDNYLDVPESNPVHAKFKKTKRDRAMLSASLFFADTITVSTEPLKERLEAHFKVVHGVDKHIVVVPNMNDITDWNYPIAKKHKDRVVIGYSGSNSHQDDLKMVLPYINNLMSKYPYLWFEIIGAIDKSKIDEYFCSFDKKNLERVAMLPATATFWEYPEYLMKQKWDIGIAPLVDTVFTRCKSHIKWLEYSMMKIPTVASRVYPYFMELAGRKTIIDGQNGFLARNNEWEEKLERLILDKGLREKIGNDSYDFVKKYWQYKDFDFNAVFAEIFKR